MVLIVGNENSGLMASFLSSFLNMARQDCYGGGDL